MDICTVRLEEIADITDSAIFIVNLFITFVIANTSFQFKKIENRMRPIYSSKCADFGCEIQLIYGRGY